MFLVRTCAECAREFIPSSRHKSCPRCRAKNSCQCGRPKMVASATCSTRRKSGGGSNANWKGGRTAHKRGNGMVWAPKHPRAARSRYVFEHILVMEESIGRCLIEGETVHHRNGVRSDNRIRNLELWTRPPTDGNPGARRHRMGAHHYPIVRRARDDFISNDHRSEPR